MPLAERDQPRLTNVVEGLCATFGLRMPDLYVVWDAVPNACASGATPLRLHLWSRQACWMHGTY